MNKKGYPRGWMSCFLLLLFAWQTAAQDMSSIITTYTIPPPLFLNQQQHTSLKPYQFAKSVPVSISFPTTFITHTKHWKIKIYSPGAVSISLIFDDFWIPKDATLYIHSDKDLKDTITWNNKIKFATRPFKGDAITLEYNSPFHVKQLPRIHISRVVYGFKSLFDLEETSHQSQQQQQFLLNRKRRPHSGKCNVDLSCDTAGMDWSNEANAVAVLLTNENQVYCTGVLLNNVEQDGRQLLLTAHHCTGASNQDTDIVLFNYQRQSCGHAQTLASRSDTLHGIRWLAGSSESDFALFEIEEKIPKEYNVYLAGWTRKDDPKPPLVGIHHPSGDFKKLSIYNGHLIPTCWSECPNKSHWKVERWTRGTTEAGSSGSPLFDANHHVVGQLHGGSASCWNKNGNDVYGSFQVSWKNGLSDYLNPFNRSINTLDGIYLNEITPE